MLLLLSSVDPRGNSSTKEKEKEGERKSRQNRKKIINFLHTRRDHNGNDDD